MKWENSQCTNPLPNRGKSKHEVLRLAWEPLSPEIPKEARVCRNTGREKKDVEDALPVLEM